MDLKEREYALLNPRPESVSSGKYSLSSAAAAAALRLNGTSRRIAAATFSSDSSSSSGGSAPSEFCHINPWPGNELDMNPRALPSISPSDHVKTLLFQLLSSISGMKGAFAHLQARLREDVTESLPMRANAAKEDVMAEELQRLSDLHMRLTSVLQEQRLDVEEHPKGCSETTTCMQEYEVCRCEEKSMLSWYQGIISRFFEEIRKKSAVIEALKETLAKSRLRGEKLEKRIKSLEAKLVDHRQRLKAAD